MTPEQWQEIETRLSYPFGSARLRVDGYDLALEVRSAKPLRLVIVPFVNGYSRGAWVLRNGAGEWCEEARRFLPLKTSRIYKPSQIKKVGKRLAKRLGMDARVEYRNLHWSSFAALKRHLIANNESIELAPETQEAKP